MNSDFPFRSAVILLLVTFITCTALLLRISKGPFFTDAVQDPSYFFLFSGTEIVTTGKTNFTDNPGITLSLLSAFSIKISMFFQKSKSEVLWFVSEQSEFLLQKLHLLMLVFDVAVLLLLNKLYNIKQKLNFPFVLFLVFTSWLPFQSLSEVSPEHILVILSIAQLSLLEIYSSKARKSSIFAGTISALGMVTKFTYFPVLVLTFYKSKNSALFLSSFLICFMIFYIPFAAQFNKSFLFVFNHSIHSSFYGSGSLLNLPTHEISSALLKVIQYVPLFIVMALCFSLNHILFNLKNYNKSILFLFFFIYFLIVLKSFHFDYLICLYIVVLFYSAKYMLQLEKRILIFSIVVGISFCFFQLKLLHNSYKNNKLQTQKLSTVLREQNLFPVIFYENASTLNYAKFFSGFIDSTHSPQTQKIRFYGNFAKPDSVLTPSKQALPLKLITEKYDTFLIIGRNTNGLGVMNVTNIPNYIKGFNSEEIFKGNSQSIIKFYRNLEN